MSIQKKFISPISIDLGAKNTGLYFAHYPEGISLSDDFEQFKSQGKVYQLTKESYTLLMANRTAKRHQRRGYDRRQLVKRLFKLIWAKHFKLTWTPDIQQTISFLLNRRGFTFLTEEYDPEELSQFPKKAYDLLPEEFKNIYSLLVSESKNIVTSPITTSTVASSSSAVIPVKTGIQAKNNKENNNILSQENEYDFDSALKEWSKDESQVKKLFKLIAEKPKEIKSRLFVIGKIKDLKQYSEQKINILKTKEKKSFNEKKANKKKSDKLPKWVFKELKQENIKGLPDEETSEYFLNSAVDIKTYLDKQDKDKVKSILESLPKVDDEEKKLKKSIWNFTPEDFKLETEQDKFTEPSSDSDNNENQKTKADDTYKNEYLKTHLNHLAYALYKTKIELDSGSRHRSKYFEEVEQVLKLDNHTHGYLKKFCENLHQGKLLSTEGKTNKSDNNNLSFTFKKFLNPETQKKWKKEWGKTNNLSLDAFIEVKALSYLISHLSNFELKPLRKYFNDIKHFIDNKTNLSGDYWDEARLAEKFDNWILNEWRVNPKKDKDKAEGKKWDYKKLKQAWKESLSLESSLTLKPRIKRWKELQSMWPVKHKGKLINFYLNIDPHYTIPPYQDNNNRRPPKCQSLILNPQYLDKHYKDWKNWLKNLQVLLPVKNYLDNYEEQLKTLKSSGSGKNPLALEEQDSFSYFGDNQSSDHQKSKKKYQQGQDYLKARILQFIFDRVKNTDPLKLNEVYSYVKKYRQSQFQNTDKAKTKEELENKEKNKEKLEKTIQKSILPESLKTKREYTNKALFEKYSFLHLICKYYKLRQKAREGRIFIHPQYSYVNAKRGYENRGRFNDKDCLLTYCNQKTRQKRYQILGDLVALLQVSPQNLESYLDKKFNSPEVQGFKKYTSEKLINEWLGQIKSLKTKCEESAKEQKDRRGQLKIDVKKVYGLIYHTKKNSSSSLGEKQHQSVIKDILNKSTVKEAHKLYKLCEKAKLICLEITYGLYQESKQESWKQDLARNPEKAIFFLAQINNIVFKERGGNAKTCTVCSMDNAQRMMQTSSKLSTFNKSKSQSLKPVLESDFSSRATRLPAIPTTLIDGAVKRMARIVGGAIAKDKWEVIKPELEKGYKVHVPIITESNRFEFEPSREELVKRQRIQKRKGKPLERGGDIVIFNHKTDRIKEANSNKLCPYTGNSIPEAGHIDHILPRASRWGTLNDEANLIWASQEGNQHKSNKELSLTDLKPEYKKSIFPEKNNDDEIKKWIIDEIWDSETEDFKFGQYRSFINLTPDQQIAFRHALFLVAHPIREKVIQAIDNLSRTLVNGTQRYFAEVLANQLYKKLLFHNKNKQNKDKKIDIKNLSFDYFGVSSDGGADSVPFVRNILEKKTDESGKAVYPELLKNKKTKEGDKVQAVESHLIDAQVAFMIALSSHYKEGCFKVKAQHISPYDYIDKNGEVHDLYKIIKVSNNNIQSQLSRRKTDKKFFLHKTFFDSEPRAWHFLKLIEIEVNGLKYYLSGFLDLKTLKDCLKQDDLQVALGIKNYPYAKLIKEKEINHFKKLYNHGPGVHQFGAQNKKFKGPKIIIDKQKLGKNKFTVKLHQLDKLKVAEFLIKYFNTKTNPKNWNEENLNTFQQLQKLWYFTKRENVIKQDGNNKNKPSKFNKPLEKKLKCTDFINPYLKQAWDHLEKYINTNTNDIYDKVEKYFLSKNSNKKTDVQGHQKSRKVFSLPVLSTGQGYMLIKRRSWNTQFIYQLQSEKSGNQGIGRYEKYKDNQGNLYDLLTPYFRSQNIVVMKKLDKLQKALKSPDSLQRIDDQKWYDLEVPEKLKPVIKEIKNQYQSKGDSNYNIVFKEEVKLKNIIEIMFSGYHIDEMKIGKNETEKIKNQEKAETFFTDCASIQEAKDKLKKILEVLNQDITKDLEQEKKNQKKEEKQFYNKWLECLNAIQDDKKTLSYKRGVGLKITT